MNDKSQQHKDLKSHTSHNPFELTGREKFYAIMGLFAVATVLSGTLGILYQHRQKTEQQQARRNQLSATLIDKKFYAGPSGNSVDLFFDLDGKKETTEALATGLLNEYERMRARDTTNGTIKTINTWQKDFPNLSWYFSKER